MEELRLQQVIQCPSCSAKFQLRGVKAHFGNAHSRPAPVPLLNLLGEDMPRNKFSTARQREEFWGMRERRSASPESEDIFDRTNVFQGGAFGLGKSRKH